MTKSMASESLSSSLILCERVKPENPAPAQTIFSFLREKTDSSLIGTQLLGLSPLATALAWVICDPFISSEDGILLDVREFALENLVEKYSRYKLVTIGRPKDKKDDDSVLLQGALEPHYIH